MIFYIILIIISFSLSMFNIRPKLLSFFSIVYLYILMYGNNSNNDYLAYLNLYKGIHNYDIEIGFRFLINLSNLFHLSYQTFLLIIGLLSFTLIGLTIFKFTTNFSLIVVFYLLSSFVMDTIIIRNTFAFSIFFFGLPFLAKGQWFKYSFFVFLSSLFHISMIFFMFALFIKFFKVKKILWSLFNIILLLILFFPLKDYLAIIMSNFLLTINIRNLNSYIFYQNLGYGYFLFFGLWVSNILTILYTYHLFKSRVKNYKHSKEILVFLNIVLFLNLLTSIFIPISALNSSFYRFIKYMILPNLLAVSIVLFPKEQILYNFKLSQSLRRTKFTPSIILYIIFFIPWFISEVSGLSFSFYLINQILNNNIISFLGGNIL